MRRLGRGIQMLRLGKRGVPMLRLGRSSPEGFVTLEDLLGALEEGQYYDDEGSYASSDDSSHARYRRSADPSQETVPSESVFADSHDSSAGDVKRSVDDGLVLPGEEEEGGYFDDENDGEVLEKRPMSMLRLGKRPMSMLRLGKRPMSMLRLGKRPMSMLRLGKREGDDEELVDEENLFEPVEEDGEFTAEKRPMNMLLSLIHI